MQELNEAKVVVGEGYSGEDGRGGIFEKKMVVMVQRSNSEALPAYRVFVYPPCRRPEEREKEIAIPVLTMTREAYPVGMGAAVVGSKLYMFGGKYWRPPKSQPSMDTYAFDLAASASASADVLKPLPCVRLNGGKFVPCTVVIEKGGKEYICALRTCFFIPSVDGPNFELFDPESKSWSSLPDPSLDNHNRYTGEVVLLQGCYVCKSRLYIWIEGQGHMLDLDNYDKGWSSFPASIPSMSHLNPPCGFAIGDGTIGWWPTRYPGAFSWQPVGKSIKMIDVPVTYSFAQEAGECLYPGFPLWHTRVGDRYLCVAECLSNLYIDEEVTTDINICVSVYSIRSADTSGVALHKIWQSELVIESCDSLRLECFVASFPNPSDSQIWKRRRIVTSSGERSRNAPDVID